MRLKFQQIGPVRLQGRPGALLEVFLRVTFVVPVLLAVVLLGAVASSKLAYPPAPRGTVTDTYFGTTVADPYRWMENIDAPETTAWVAAEGALTRGYLDAIPQRAAIKDRLTQVINYEKFGLPFREGRHYFYTHNSGLQNQAVYYIADSPTQTGRVFFDPNTLSKDGTVSLGGLSFSEDGKYVAYATQSAGSDVQTWHVRVVDTGKDLPDTIEWTKFSDTQWLPDDSGYYYESYDKPAEGLTRKVQSINQKVRLHKLGTPQSADRLIYADPKHPTWYFDVSVTEDGRYLLLTTSDGGPNNRLYYRGIHDKGPFIPLYVKGDASYGVIGNIGSRFYAQTNAGAPRGRVFAFDVRNPKAQQQIIAQGPDPLNSVSMLGGRLIADYFHDVHSVDRVYDLRGRKLADIKLPGLGTAAGFGGHQNDTLTFYTFVSYVMPGTIYSYNVLTGKTVAIHKPKVSFDPSQFVSEEVFYRSKDGTRVPMIISHRKGIKRDGTMPTILYAYGGFDIPMQPSFSATRLAWMEMGGIYAVANLRGGSEYGEAWHNAGMLSKKQNVFDDFIAAAHYLIDNHYTSTPKLAINGGSNGGLLMGAVETQVPSLFGAVIAEVGVMDMLRFQKFTVGSGWIPEYGSSEASDAEFKTLYAYSPYHNIKQGTVYPPTLIMTADHDDRVFPAHSFKFAAAMQNAQAGDAPILLRVESNAGHGGGTPTSKAIEEAADRYAFLVKNLGM